MNRPPHHLADHAGDELLSAHLDDAVEGEERVALEEHLAACALCRERLSRLGAHAPALSVEPLDDVARRRLVGNALAAFDDRVVAPRRRPPVWWRSPQLLAAAAVTLLMAIGLTAVLSSGGDDDAESVAANAGGGEGFAIPEDVVVGHIGTFDDPAALRTYLGTEAEQSAGGSGGGAAISGGGAGDSAGSTTGEADQAPADGDEAPTDEGTAAPEPAPQELRAPPARTASRPASEDPGGRADAERCLETLGDAVPADAEIALVATGTFQDQRAVALVFEADGRFLAFVAARDGCTILAFQSFAG